MEITAEVIAKILCYFIGTILALFLIKYLNKENLPIQTQLNYIIVILLGMIFK